jgi:hypothetical protein
MPVASIFPAPEVFRKEMTLADIALRAQRAIAVSRARIKFRKREDHCEDTI